MQDSASSSETPRSGSTSTLLKGLIYPALLALILGVSKPFWWDTVFPGDGKKARDSVQAAASESALPAHAATVKNESQQKEDDVTHSDGTKPTQPNEDHTPGPAGQGGVVEEHNPVPPVMPVSQTVTRDFEEIGKWGRSVHGDNEVGSKAGESVSVLCRGALVHDGKKVTLQLSYRLVENKGDRTTFNATKNIVVWARTPAGKKIVDVTSRAGKQCSSKREITGENHRPNAMPNLQDTFFDNLRCIIDGSGREDDKNIGVTGRVRFEIQLIDE